MQRVFIATPTYSGQMAVEYVGSLLANLMDLTKHGILPDIEFFPGLLYIELVRNQLVTLFLKSEATHLLYWDDDVGAAPDAVRRLLAHDVEVVAGVYPRKNDDLSFPCILNEERQGELLGADGLPAGFMCIRRDVLERMIAAFPERVMTDPVTGNTHNMLFSNELVDKTWWGEDYRFCQLARSIGIKLWADPDISFRHVGRKVWHGNLKTSLDEKRGITPAIKALTSEPITQEQVEKWPELI